MSDSFTIKDAINEYQVIDAEFSNGILTEFKAKERIAALNKKCVKGNVVFEASFNSLEEAPNSTGVESQFEGDDSYAANDDDDSYDSWG